MPHPIPITVVRFDEHSARERLHTYLFEGRYGGGRPPRGVEPRLVSEYIQEKIKPDSEPDVYKRVAELLRFYERPDALRTLRLALNGHESKAVDALRSAYALQAIGDLGTTQEAAQAADYFERVIVRRPELTAELYPILFDTVLALTPAGSTAALAQRLDQDLAKLAPAQRTSEEAMFAYDKLAAVKRNDLPKFNSLIEFKKQIAGAPQDVRRAEMVRVYLGISPRGGASIGTWCARMLRKEAMEADPEPVYAEFSKSIDAIDEKKFGRGPADLIFIRGAQAILYLQGHLTAAQRKRFSEAGQSGANFLWDDLPISPNTGD